MKEYESVSIELVLFKEQQDIITTSNGGGVVFEDETVYGVMPNWWKNGFGG